MTSNLSDVIAIIKEQVKKIPELRKCLSASNQVVFATDLSVVAFRIRTGYLVDLFSPKDPVDLFSGLLSALRGNPSTKDYFASVLHLYEPASEQSFFVNIALLAPRIKAYDSNGHGPTQGADLQGHLTSAFVHLRSPIEISNDVPSQVLKLLNLLLQVTVTSEPPLSFSLPSDTSIEAAVPLAAVLLDYLVAYVPSPSHDNVLSGIPLDFYECSLAFQRSNRNGSQKAANPEITCVILKFSCPTELGQDKTSQIHPERLVKMLQEIFTERLEWIGDLTMRITVKHDTQTLDHVAL